MVRWSINSSRDYSIFEITRVMKKITISFNCLETIKITCLLLKHLRNPKIFVILHGLAPAILLIALPRVFHMVPIAFLQATTSNYLLNVSNQTLKTITRWVIITRLELNIIGNRYKRSHTSQETTNISLEKKMTTL